MDDLISRSMAIAEIEDYIEEYSEVDDKGLHNPKWCAMQEAKMALEHLPIVDAKQIILGQWITNKYGDTVCSKCGYSALEKITGCLVNRHYEPTKSKFCPTCGAKMDLRDGVDING